MAPKALPYFASSFVMQGICSRRARRTCSSEGTRSYIWVEYLLRYPVYLWAPRRGFGDINYVQHNIIASQQRFTWHEDDSRGRETAGSGSSRVGRGLTCVGYAEIS